MNSRAFNLFTALISFVLIMLAVLMVNTMTRTEERANATIADLQQQSEMQTIADLTRGDAFQIVVFKIRQALEDYFLRDQTYAVIDPSMDWPKIKENFSCSQLGLCGPCTEPDPADCRNDKTQLAQFVSTQIEGLIYSGSQFGRYEIRPLEGVNQDTFRAAVTTSLDTAYQNKISVSDGAGGTTLEPEVFQLVDCAGPDHPTPDDPAGCPGGTFYVTMDFSRHADGTGLSDTLYEQLPKIVVTDYNVTGAVLKTALIPRAKLRVFVPVRFFQALARAKRIADNTVFQPAVQANLSSMEVGTCQVDDCSVTAQLSIAPAEFKHRAGDSLGALSACAGTNASDAVVPGLLAPSADTLLGASGISVDPNSSIDLLEGLGNYAKQYLCAAAAGAVPDEIPDASGFTAHDDELRLVTATTGTSADCVFSAATFAPGIVSRDIRLNSTAGVGVGTAYCASFKRATSKPYVEVEFKEENSKYMVNNQESYRENSTTGFTGTFKVRIYPASPAATIALPTLGTCVDVCESALGAGPGCTKSYCAPPNMPSAAASP